jgi:hypothetical protein
MVTTLGFLKEAGRLEKELANIACERTLEKLAPYAGYPEVAKVIDYVTSYREDVPSGHMVWTFIESLEAQKKRKDEVKSVVRDRLNKKGLLSEKQKQEIAREEQLAKEERRKRAKTVSKEDEAEIRKELEKSVKISEKMESLIVELERNCDTAWEFFNKNANSMGRIVKPYKLNGIRNTLSLLKGNLRALKVR